MVDIMEFQYRGHTITIKDKVVECFTGMIEPSVTERLFDSYARIELCKEEQQFEDIDFTKFSDEELSYVMENSMLDECLVYFELRGVWEKEIVKIKEEKVAASGEVGSKKGGE